MEEHIEQRLSSLRVMLLKMLSGSYYQRIKRSEHNDILESFILGFNVLAEEFQDVLIHQGYVNRNAAILDVVQMSFIIDEHGMVEMVNKLACKTLSRRKRNIIDRPFEALLTEGSVKKWKNVFQQCAKRRAYDTSVDLVFKSKGGLEIPKTVYVSRYYKNAQGYRTLITVIHHTNYQKKLQSGISGKINKVKLKGNKRSLKDRTALLKKSKVRLSLEDIQKIKRAHDMILANLEDDFPSLKEFALQLGTNEFKLKYGFKELYGTTVHKFLIEERLRKALMMVLYSDRLFKSIAEMTGFKSLPHFSRAFKNAYGHSPSEMRKMNNV
ncbi:helix-turn-helix domain-containing protein [Gelidibacter maritimus]|uniref:Helix-turn-helix domain-containing protein n=1 Tax=Gelidibacter maritimus TaxID=2761487 RepID=A0A7W2M5M4_9FLAO|nr:helix-turn-helix domain-containing protein [Gelidibacter maritimus]MBA6153092.1 helix-turn-helix domain-containing protein [Gelidibacter maritimus]